MLVGLEGGDPETVDPDSIEPTLQRIRTSHRIRLLGRHEIDFNEKAQLLLLRTERLPAHPNGMRFAAAAADGKTLREEEYYSIGGGFIVRGGEDSGARGDRTARSRPTRSAPRPSCSRSAGSTGSSSSSWCWRTSALGPARRRCAPECCTSGRSCAAASSAASIRAVCCPGPLKVRRRAPKLYRVLSESGPSRPLDAMDWVNAFALAVNEENAAGGRVVTAPTNGAAGIVPAVLHFYRRFEPGASDEGVMRFLLAAAAIGMLYKRNASISGAEMGCQGEVGVACSMAAAGLVAALQGSNEQIENAAEIGMEHNLGLTCDPVGGLVQIPCIERNAMGAVKAINAARLAMRGDGSHKVSLDHVIATMRQTGADMSTIYKETSQGGLAVNVTEC